MGEDLVPVGERDAEHGARKDLCHVSRQFDWFFFRHNVVERSNFAILLGKINFFRSEKDGQPLRFGYTPATMRSDTLSGILTFILGVLVVASVCLAVRMVMLNHELRTLQKQAVHDQAVLLQTQQIYNDAAAYNQKYPSADLTHILSTVAQKSARQ
jgi:hypothetical protein